MKKTITILFFFLSATRMEAQNQSYTDTLSLARHYAYDKKFDEANYLLSAYNAIHTDVDAMSFHAMLLYWMKKYKDAAAVYEKTLSLFPEAISVKLDYGRLLFQMNKFFHSRQLLTGYLQANHANIEANSMLAYIDLWTGHLKAAKKRAMQLKQLDPGNQDADHVLQQIVYYTVPNLKTQGVYYSDDQPLNYQSIEIAGSLYKSWLLAPFLKTNLKNIKTDKPYFTTWIEAGNKFQIASSKTDMDVSAGYFQGSNVAATLGWKMKLTQKTTTNLSFDASIEKKPYQYTVTSIKTPFLFKVAETGINLNIKNQLLARGAFQNQHFDDRNNVQTVYLWLLASIFHKDNYSLKAGYAFSYATADQNTFTPKNPQSVPPILNKEIDGIYTPYFTPSDQTIHAVLASLEIPFSKSLQFSSKLNIGVIAHASQPSLYVDKNGSGPFFINKKFEKLQYTPVDISCGLEAKLSQIFSITGYYAFNQLIFFKSHSANIQLNHLFFNDKKGK
jgi:hypothetical protein